MIKSQKAIIRRCVGHGRMRLVNVKKIQSFCTCTSALVNCFNLLLDKNNLFVED